MAQYPLTPFTLQSKPEQLPSGSLRSFDVFDTVLTRIWLRPADVFLHVGTLLENTGGFSIPAVDWALARRNSEADLRRTMNGREVTLEKIYDVLQHDLHWSNPQRRIAQDFELSCERIASRPIPTMTGVIQSFLSANRKVAYISDFYISGDFVFELLVGAGLSLGREDLSVSCDEDATKRSGALYLAVAKRRGIPLQSLIHTGDHPVSDVIMAKRVGATAIPYLQGKATSCELLLASKQTSAAEQLSASLIAGSARRARLSSSNERYPDTWSLATGVAGPLLFGYVFWLLHEAKTRSIDRLYFLARDGQILLKIATEINDTAALGLELRYLSASRSAWFLASAAAGRPSDRAAALIPDKQTVVDDILKRIDVAPHSVMHQLQAWGFADGTDRQRTIQEQQDLERVKAMLGTPPLSELIARRSSTELLETLEFLGAQGMLDGTTFAIVDIGWRGRLQQALASLLRQSRSSAVPTGFYLGLRELPPVSEAGVCLTYFESSDALSINPSLAEVFCSADHGTVKHYFRSSDGVVRPLLAPAENHESEIWNLQVFQSGIQMFARYMIDAMPVHPASTIEWCKVFRSCTLTSMRRLVQFPSRAEAEVLGSHSHASNQFHSDSTDLAPRLSAFLFIKALVTPRSISNLGHWQQGSIGRSIYFSQAALHLWAYRMSVFTNLKRILRVLSGRDKGRH